MRFLRFGYKLIIFGFITLVIIIVGLYTNAYLSPAIELNSLGTYQLYDKDENLIYHGNSSTEWTSIENISPNLINAVVAIEDKNFYKHNGFDYLRILKAFIKNISNNKIMEGASTISQQYIKNAYLEFDKTWSRKIKEALMTLNLETHYSKNEILEAYLNTINYGQGKYGINSASKYYFNKTPNTLSLEEATILAGIPKSPNKNNPIYSYDNSIKRAKMVSLAMLNNNYIDKQTYNNMFKNDISISKANDIDNLQMIMYYNDAVLKELKSIDGITEEMINSGNLKVYTTLDYSAQSILEKEILNNVEDEDLQISSIIANPQTGEILALTGGMDYTKSQYNRAISSKRQVGSTMKPFLYYAALENGMTSSSTFLSQYTTFNLENGKTYSPKNFANIYGNKEITMAAALSYSDNIYAVKTNLFLGTDQLINTALRCGINEKLKNVPSLALGTSEVSLLDFTNGYNTFASGGYKRKLHTIKQIEDSNGNIIYKYQKENNLVLNPNYVYILNELLTSTTNAAFSDYNTPTALNIASKLSQKYAIKTGTTDTDYLTVGYNKNIIMTMWTGYDKNKNIPLSIGSLSKNIWANTVEQINKSDNSWYDQPDNVVGMALNAIDGTPTQDNTKSNIFYYLKGSEPQYNF